MVLFYRVYSKVRMWLLITNNNTYPHSPIGSLESVIITSNLSEYFSINLIPSLIWMVNLGDENPTDIDGKYFFETSITF